MATAKKNLTQADLKAAIDKINSLREEFRKELALLKIERKKIIERINKKADDKKIQEILKRIK